VSHYLIADYQEDFTEIIKDALAYQCKVGTDARVLKQHRTALPWLIAAPHDLHLIDATSCPPYIRTHL